MVGEGAAWAFAETMGEATGIEATWAVSETGFLLEGSVSEHANWIYQDNIS